jgi:hypothetical protein
VTVPELAANGMSLILAAKQQAAKARIYQELIRI